MAISLRALSAKTAALAVTLTLAQLATVRALEAVFIRPRPDAQQVTCWQPSEVTRVPTVVGGSQPCRPPVDDCRDLQAIYKAVPGSRIGDASASIDIVYNANGPAGVMNYLHVEAANGVDLPGTTSGACSIDFYIDEEAGPQDHDITWRIAQGDFWDLLDAVESCDTAEVDIRFTRYTVHPTSGEVEWSDVQPVRAKIHMAITADRTSCNEACGEQYCKWEL